MRYQTSERWSQIAWRLAALPLLLLFFVPILLLLTRTTPADLLTNLAKENVQQAIWISLRTTFISLGVTILLGVPLAYVMAHQQFRLKRFVDTLIDLPMVLPPSVAGVALLITFGRRGLVGGWLESIGIQVAFTQFAVVLAQVFISAPFFVRTAALGFANIDDEIAQAAQLDGAGSWQAFRFIVLPLTKIALISGAVLAWARALGEFGATIIFAGNFPGRTQTMPTAIYLGFEVDIGMAVTLSAILLVISFLAILVVKTLTAPREED